MLGVRELLRVDHSLAAGLAAFRDRDCLRVRRPAAPREARIPLGSALTPCSLRCQAGRVEANDWITLAAVLVAVIATVPAYVSLRFTKTAADSAVAQTELQRAIAHEARLPMLWADIRPHPEARSVIGLFVGNSGPTTAHDVQVVIEPRIIPGQVRFSCDVAQDTAAAGIAALPPGRTLEWTLGVGTELVKAPDQPEEFTIAISGRASDGTALADTFKSRFSDIRHTRASGGNLEEIAQQMKHLLTEARAMGRAVQQVASRDDEED